jgi:pyroglutamyl-peptidase
LEYQFTGFQPFLAHAYNPSWDAATAAAEALASRAYELEVTFEAAERDAAWLVQPGRCVVMFGLAAKSVDVRFERFAHNVRGIAPLEEGPLDDSEDTLRETAVDIGALAMAWDEVALKHGLPRAALSRDAGNYVCNAIYWHALGACENDAQALFVHIPPVTPEIAKEIGQRLAGLLAVSVER